MTDKGPILVATDLSARADRAIDRGARLARETGRQLAVLHVVSHAEADDASYTALEQRVEAVLPENVPDCRIVIREGDATYQIGRAVEEENAWCLVIGVARYNSVGDYFLGTAVDHTLRHTDNPVLVIKQRATKNYSDIVIATDFSPRSKHALEQGAAMFPDARLHLVHAYSIPFESWQNAEYVQEEVRADAQKKLDEFAAGLDISDAMRSRMTTKLLKGSPHRAISREVQEYGAGLVIIGSHGHSGLRQTLLGSTTSDLLRSLPVDTLVIRVAKN